MSPQVTSAVQFYCAACNEICSIEHSSKELHLKRIRQLTFNPDTKDIKPETVFLPMITQAVRNETNYTCPRCDRLIEYKHLYEHVTTSQHPTDDVVLQCVVCHIILNSSNELIEHIDSIEHETAVKDRIVSNRPSYNPFVEILALIDAPNKQCSFLYLTVVANLLDAKKKVVLPEDAFFCVFCKWSSENQSKLVSHLLSSTHLEKMSLQKNSMENDTFCCICKKFCNPSNHKGTKKHKRSISQLGENLPIEDNIFKHIKIIPKIVNESEYSVTEKTNGFVFTCSLCKVVLQGSASLYDHIESSSHMENVSKLTNFVFCQIFNLMIFQDSQNIELGFIYAASRQSNLKEIHDFVCSICRIKLNHYKKLKMHLISQEHREKLKNITKAEGLTVKHLKPMSQPHREELENATATQEMKISPVENLKPIPRQLDKQSNNITVQINSAFKFYCPVCKKICDISHCYKKSHCKRIDGLKTTPDSGKIKPEKVFLPLNLQISLNETNYTCPTCNELIEHDYLRQHMTLKHQLDNIVIQCVVCQAILDTNHKLIEHLISIQHESAIKKKTLASDIDLKNLCVEILAFIDFPNKKYSFLYMTTFKSLFKKSKKSMYSGSTFVCIPCKWNSQNKTSLVNHLSSPEHVEKMSTSMDEIIIEDEKFCYVCNVFCKPSLHTESIQHETEVNRLKDIFPNSNQVDTLKDLTIVPQIVHGLEYSIIETTNEFLFTCSICKLLLQGIRSLLIHLDSDRHVENFHKNTDSLFCKILNFMIFQDSKCIELGFVYGSCYESKLKGIKHFVCSICPKMVVTIQELKAHLICTHHYKKLNLLRTKNFDDEDLKMLSQRYNRELKKIPTLLKMKEIQMNPVETVNLIPERVCGEFVTEYYKSPEDQLTNRKVFCYVCKIFFSFQQMDEHEKTFQHCQLNGNSPPYIWKNPQICGTDESYCTQGLCGNSIEGSMYFICFPCKSIVQGNNLFARHLKMPKHVEKYEKLIRGVRNSPSNELSIKISSLLIDEKDLETFQEQPFLYTCISNLYLSRSTKEYQLCTICNRHMKKDMTNHLNSAEHVNNILKLKLKINLIFCKVCLTSVIRQTHHTNNSHHKSCMSKLQQMFNSIQKNALSDDESVFLVDTRRVLETIKQYKCYSCDVSLDRKGEFIRHLESYKHRVRAWKQLNDTVLLYTCSICKCYLPGEQALASHCLTTDHIRLLTENLKSGQPCLGVCNLVIDFSKDHQMTLEPFLYALDTDVHACLLCNTYLSGSIDLMADLTSSRHKTLDLIKDNVKISKHRVYLSEDVVTDLTKELDNCREIRTRPSKITTSYFNVPYKKEYLLIEDEIFQFGLKKFQPFRLIDESFYWLVKDEKILCIVCDEKFDDTALSCFKHVQFDRHKEKLKIFEQSDCQYLANGLSFTFKQVNVKLAEKEKRLRCHHCQLWIESSEKCIRAHLKRKSHQKNCKKYKKTTDDFWPRKLAEFENIWYGIQRYACVPCGSRWFIKIDFIQHIYKKHFPNKNLELHYDFCLVCTCLWLGYENTLRDHCSNVMHRYFQQGRDFTVDEMPHTVINLLKHFNQNVEELYRLSDLSGTINYEKQNETVECLEKLLTPHIPRLKIYLFGSRVTGLGFPDSDLDIFIDCGDAYHGGQTDENSVSQLEEIAKILLTDEKTWEITDLREHARTPIINLRHSTFGIKCDISVINGLAVENSHLIKFYNDYYPLCRRLILFLKRWLALCGLPGPANIKNYPLYWLVVFYLQKQKILPRVADLKKNPAPLVNGWEVGIVTDYVSPTNPPSPQTFCDLLGGFYRFYATFDFRYNVICPLIGEELKKIDFTEPDKLPIEMARYIDKINSKNFEYFRVDSAMCIQDPFDLSDNPTKAVKPLTVKYFKQYCQDSANILSQSSPSALKKNHPNNVKFNISC